MLAVALALVAGLSILFYLALRPFFRDSVLEPILRGLFLVRWYVGRISQVALWDILVAVGGLLLLRTVLRRRARESRRPACRETRETDGELDRLSEAIRLAGRRPLFRAMIRRDLVRVAAQVVSRGERIPPGDACAWLEDESVHHRPALAAFFAERDLGRRSSVDAGFLGKLDETLAFLEGYF